MSDILFQALKELKVGEEILVSLRGFRNIRDRFQEFRNTNRMIRFVVRPDSGFQKITRKE